jgi:hypothetical protein
MVVKVRFEEKKDLGCGGLSVINKSETRGSHNLLRDTR